MSKVYQDRSTVIKGLFVLAAGFLLLKSLQLQLIDTSYQDRARTTAIDKYVLYPSRGLIYDRTGQLLVNNKALYDLKVTYNQVDPKMDTLKFCHLLGLDKATFIKNLDKNWRSPRFSKSVPYVFLSKISAQTCAAFQEHLYEFPGFDLQLRIVRGYPYRNAAHVLGYLNEVKQAQIDSSNNWYTQGDYIGWSGLESVYEPQLRGRKGARYVMKDNLGREVGSFKNGKLDTVAISGQDLVTTLDIKLQQYGEQLMQNKTGSIVAIEPSTGDVLAMISAPTYDPNMLTIHRNRGRAYQQLSQDSLRPFFDRSIMAKYPPGSIFKTIISLVGMQEGVLAPDRFISCNAGYYYNGRRYGCHAHPPAHGVEMALKHSCNAYYFTVVRDIIEKYGFKYPQRGLDTLVEHAYDFGIGVKLGIDIPNERKGNMPTSAYYNKIYKGNPWYSTNIMSIGIGQGEIQMTTLQMANLAATIANKGVYHQPHLIKGFRDGDALRVLPQEKPRTTRIDTSYFKYVINGMEQAVIGGTAKIAYEPELQICGKTGTSQNPHGADHSVFFAFAPKENPQIAIAVYVEHGVWGSSYAAPIASLMIEQYMKGEIGDKRKWLEERMMKADLINKP